MTTTARKTILWLAGSIRDLGNDAEVKQRLAGGTCRLQDGQHDLFVTYEWAETAITAEGDESVARLQLPGGESCQLQSGDCVFVHGLGLLPEHLRAALSQAGVEMLDYSSSDGEIYSTVQQGAAKAGLTPALVGVARAAVEYYLAGRSIDLLGRFEHRAINNLAATGVEVEYISDLVDRQHAHDLCQYLTELRGDWETQCDAPLSLLRACQTLLVGSLPLSPLTADRQSLWKWLRLQKRTGWHKPFHAFAAVLGVRAAGGAAQGFEDLPDSWIRAFMTGLQALVQEPADATDRLLALPPQAGRDAVAAVLQERLPAKGFGSYREWYGASQQLFSELKRAMQR